jgi:hypothetical protein
MAFAHQGDDRRVLAEPPPSLGLRLAHHRHDPPPSASSSYLSQGLLGGGQIGEDRVEIPSGASGKCCTGSFRELVKGESTDRAVIA